MVRRDETNLSNACFRPSSPPPLHLCAAVPRHDADKFNVDGEVLGGKPIAITVMPRSVRRAAAPPRHRLRGIACSCLLAPVLLMRVRDGVRGPSIRLATRAIVPAPCVTLTVCIPCQPCPPHQRPLVGSVILGSVSAQAQPHQHCELPLLLHQRPASTPAAPAPGLGRLRCMTYAAAA